MKRNLVLPNYLVMADGSVIRQEEYEVERVGSSFRAEPGSNLFSIEGITYRELVIAGNYDKVTLGYPCAVVTAAERVPLITVQFHKQQLDVDVREWANGKPVVHASTEHLLEVGRTLPDLQRRCDIGLVLSEEKMEKETSAVLLSICDGEKRQLRSHSPYGGWDKNTRFLFIAK